MAVTPDVPDPVGTARVTLARELLSYRVNRFLYLHAALLLAIGLLALFAPPEAASPATAWWILNGVLYVASLSALLLGLSSAQAEGDELALLFTQPIRTGAWVGGKAAGLALVTITSAGFLVLPTVIAAGPNELLLGAAIAAAAVSALLAWVGLAIGFWVHDHVRGLIAALASWCVLLFGVDLLLIAVGGSSWVHANPGTWVAALMMSPFDTYRVTVVFVLERAAYEGANLGPLTRWWLEHPITWFAVCIVAWSAIALAGAARGAVRRRRWA